MTNPAEMFLNTEIQVNAYDLVVVELPLATPFNLPFGTIETRPSVWLQVSGEVDGVPGNGAAEGTSLPIQIPLYDDCSGNLEQNVSRVMGTLAGERLTLHEAGVIIADVALNGTFATARMTAETALLDMAARTKGTSVYEAITGHQLDGPIAVPYGKSIAENEYGKLVDAGVAAAERGAQRLKFKLSPGNHAAVTAGIRELQRHYPDASFMVDANGMFDPNNTRHLAMLAEVDALGLMMIEEPVSRAKEGTLRGLNAHRQLKRKMTFDTPVALDDSITSRESARVALEEGLGEIINLKPGRVGSFVECLQVADMAKQTGNQIMVGGMLEATPGRTMTLTLAALCLREGFTIPGDVSLPQERITQDLLPATEQLRLDDNNNVIFHPGKGWGYKL